MGDVASRADMPSSHSHSQFVVLADRRGPRPIALLRLLQRRQLAVRVVWSLDELDEVLAQSPVQVVVVHEPQRWRSLAERAEHWRGRQQELRWWQFVDGADGAQRLEPLPLLTAPPTTPQTRPTARLSPQQWNVLIGAALRGTAPPRNLA